MIHFEEIGPENWRMGLRVAKSQKHFVSDEMRLLARAYAFRKNRSTALLIYHDDVPVGMALYYDCPELAAYDLSQFFIDERYQGRGYGIEAVRQILERLEIDGRYHKVYICYIDGNDAAKRMYEKLGFQPNGDRDGDEIVMEKIL